MSFSIVFMGTPQFAIPTFEALIENPEVKIKAVVTKPDSLSDRGLKKKFSELKKIALKYNYPILQPHSLKDANFLEQLKSFQPNLIVVVSYGKILPSEVLHLPEYGCLNVHASLLPKYRGAAPIQWALINREKTTGITIMQMDEGLDTGFILAQKEINIEPNSTYGSIYNLLAQLGANLLMEILPQIKESSLLKIPQPTEGVIYAPRIKEKETQINWNLDYQKICGWIQALNPKPGAFSFLQKSSSSAPKRLKIWRVEPLPEFVLSNYRPGEIIAADKKNGFLVACRKGAIRLLEVQFENKRSLSAKEFINGFHFQPGLGFEFLETKKVEKNKFSDSTVMLKNSKIG